MDVAVFAEQFGAVVAFGDGDAEPCVDAGGGAFVVGESYGDRRVWEFGGGALVECGAFVEFGSRECGELRMERLEVMPRLDWEQRVESQGFLFHTTEEGPYWNEEACYRFTAAEIDALDAATYALNDLCLAAVEAVIQGERWEEFGVAAPYREWIKASWKRDELSVVGRFDLAFDGSGPPKLLEYNADTPTALLEAAVIQWQWLKDTRAGADQFNTIHEKLIEAWGRVKAERVGMDPVHFAAVADHVEDFMTVNYLRDTAMQAGIATEYLDVEAIGWNEMRGAFVDSAERPLLHVFKLYPWEWMLAEAFGPQVVKAGTRWLEAPWKMLLSNKAILAVLWELFPGNEYLLEATLGELSGDVVIKPRQAREGANVKIVQGGRVVAETGGTYAGAVVRQRYCAIQKFGGNTPVVGSWMINGYAAGIGIREDASAVTGNWSRFVPHFFE